MITAMLRETREAAEAVERALASNRPALELLRQRLLAAPPPFVVTCARGSSDAAALFLKYLLEIHIGVPVASLGPSVASVYGRQLRMPGALFVAISQSGSSPDLVEACRNAGRAGAFRVALLNDTSSPLAHEADLVLPLCAGPELSVAATKSCLVSMALAIGVAEAVGADLSEEVVTVAGTVAAALAAGPLDLPAFEPRLSTVFTVGRGPGLAIAVEAALKIKETCRMHAEAISGAEILHGPVAIADSTLSAIVFDGGDATRPGLLDLAERLRGTGVETRVASVDQGHAASGLLGLLSRFYLAIERVSRDLGFNPDMPVGLSKVTRTV